MISYIELLCHIYFLNQLFFLEKVTESEFIHSGILKTSLPKYPNTPPSYQHVNIQVCCIPFMLYRNSSGFFSDNQAYIAIASNPVIQQRADQAHFLRYQYSYICDYVNGNF